VFVLVSRFYENIGNSLSVLFQMYARMRYCIIYLDTFYAGFISFIMLN